MRPRSATIAWFIRTSPFANAASSATASSSTAAWSSAPTVSVSKWTPRGHKKVPQIGIVQIDDDVEIGASTTIDRARFGRTWIQEGVKIDNLVQIAHNVVIGKHSIIVAQVGIAGSVRIGSSVRDRRAGWNHWPHRDRRRNHDRRADRRLEEPARRHVVGDAISAVEGVDGTSRLGAPAREIIRACPSAGEEAWAKPGSQVAPTGLIGNIVGHSMPNDNKLLDLVWKPPSLSVLRHKEDLPRIGILDLLPWAISGHVHITAVRVEWTEDVARFAWDGLCVG